MSPYTLFLIDRQLNAVVDHEYVHADSRNEALCKRPAHWKRREVAAYKGFIFR